MQTAQDHRHHFNPAGATPLLRAHVDGAWARVDSGAETCDEAAERRGQSKASDLRPLILVADDEALIRKTIVQILRNEGYDAVAVRDGAEAVECAHKIQPDIFLADVAMPRLDGIEAAKQIRKSLPATRIICFSGHAATSELITKARNQGHDFEFLAKPIKPEALILAIRGKSA